jgi:predicted  nucleic acid-binding Zn-ribbon protein
MANSGVNKIQVKKARNALLARGDNPSIDAVRVELGNTGSKTTISNYLRELASEEAVGKKAGVSEVVLSLVENLSSQLHQEAQQVIEDNQSNHQTTINTLKSQKEELSRQLDVAQQQISEFQVKFKNTEIEHKSLLNKYQVLSISAGKLEQQLTDKNVQLEERDKHIQSLEEKHLHAREALEHYRNSSKDQRDQDQRRHENQIQQLQAEIRQLNQTLSIKQTDITQLNKDNARLTTELNSSRKQGIQLERQLEQLESSYAQAEEKSTKEYTSQIQKLEQTVNQLNIELVSVQAELRVKNQLFESINIRVQ